MCVTYKQRGLLEPLLTVFHWKYTLLSLQYYKIHLCVTFKQRGRYNLYWKQSLTLHKEEFEDTNRLIWKWVKLDKLVSYQIRLYNINSLFYLFSDRIYYQINNFIFYVLISWPLHRKLKRWATRIPPKPGDEPRSSWRVNSSCFL
jgi:hypothetical protein